MKLSALWGFHKGICEENYLKKQMDNIDRKRYHNYVQAHTQQVMHNNQKNYSYCGAWTVGESQIIHLPFKCKEADVAPSWGDWPFP